MAPSSLRVLVTGATGTLGRHVVGLLDQRAAASLRILSRRERPSEAQASRDWCRADLLDGALEPALRDVDVVLHLASAKGVGNADVLAARRLLAAAEAARVRHFVLISIIGCDAIPLPYYASKLRIEAIVRSGGVPWSIVRVAQFHSFVDRLVRTAATLPVPSAVVTTSGSSRWTSVRWPSVSWVSRSGRRPATLRRSQVQRSSPSWWRTCETRKARRSSGGGTRRGRSWISWDGSTSRWACGFTS
jgi:NAD(P)-dependent dehydrogenase (short-subunit alcohol dehydrogenase family)